MFQSAFYIKYIYSNFFNNWYVNFSNNRFDQFFAGIRNIMHLYAYSLLLYEKLLTKLALPVFFFSRMYPISVQDGGIVNMLDFVSETRRLLCI